MSFQRFLIKLIGPLGKWLFSVKYVGKENIPATGGVILASNHISAIDPLLLAFDLKREFNIMAKKELFSFKPFGWLLKKAGAFPVERGHGDRGAIKRAAEVLENERMLIIFPEGTRSKDGKLIAFKSGTAMFAISTHTPILLVYIHAPNGIGIFKKTIVEYGKIIMPKQLGVSQATSSQLKIATGKIKDEFEKMEDRGMPQ